METLEHTKAGNQILAEYPANFKYLTGGKDHDGTIVPLEIEPMRMDAATGLPRPTGVRMKAGEMVALAGDYFTKPGWGLQLNLPEAHGVDKSPYEHAAAIAVTEQEQALYQSVYATLVAPEVDRNKIDQIYKIETAYEQNASTLNQYITQVKLMGKVSHYLDALKYNEAHFAPWSTRAYIVGHKLAMDYAKVSYELSQIAEHELVSDQASAQTQDIIAKLEHCSEAQSMEIDDLFREYSERYYALAVGIDLSVMHYYSDHYAAGHLGRLGRMREYLSEQYGFIGQTLVNSMHNEDNDFGVIVTHGNRDGGFQLPERMDITPANGDGTYASHSNDENANDLVNGMTASLGELYRAGIIGEQTKPENYEAAEFLPHVDLDAEQYQPMFVLKPNGDIYYRNNIATAYKMTPDAYKALQTNPEAFDGYNKLSTWRAMKLFVRLRIATLIPYFWPSPQKASEEAPLITCPVSLLNADENSGQSYGLMHRSGVSVEKDMVEMAKPRVDSHVSVQGLTLGFEVKPEEAIDCIEQVNTSSSSVAKI